MKKGLRRAKQRLVFLIVLFIGGCLFVGTSILKVWIQIIDNKHSIVALTDEYNRLCEEEKQLKSDVNKLQDPDYVARYAREKYLYTKDGELIIKMPDDSEQ